MKKNFTIIMAFLLIGATLFGCKQEESLTDTMRSSLGIEETLIELGRLEGENAILLFADTADKTCYAGKFLKSEDGYTFAETVNLTKCNGNNYMCKWEDGYAFICNDERSAAFKAAITPAGEESVITDVQIESFPWVYYLALPEGIENYSGSYFFLDAQGGIVS